MVAVCSRAHLEKDSRGFATETKNQILEKLLQFYGTCILYMSEFN